MVMSCILGAASLYAAGPEGKDICQKNYSGYKDRITKNPLDDEAWTELRVCTTERKKWDDAIQVALQARLKNRDLPQPYLILGLAQMQQKNYERAVEHFDQTIALKSGQPIAYFQMGMAYLFLNEPTKAAQAAERDFSAGSTTARSGGKVIVAAVPAPTVLCKSIVPWCSSMIPLTAGRPRPVP